MKTLIVCVSVSHGNTRKVADVFAEVLGAEISDPGEVDPGQLGNYELVAFGSGIFNQQFHPRLRAFVDALPAGQSGRAVVFSTSGLPEVRLLPYTSRMSKSLGRKGFTVADTFSCRAFDTWAPFRLLGGIRKGRPDAADLAAARAFATSLVRS